MGNKPITGIAKQFITDIETMVKNFEKWKSLLTAIIEEKEYQVIWSSGSKSVSIIDENLVWKRDDIVITIKIDDKMKKIFREMLKILLLPKIDDILLEIGNDCQNLSLIYRKINRIIPTDYYVLAERLNYRLLKNESLKIYCR